MGFFGKKLKEKDQKKLDDGVKDSIEGSEAQTSGVLSAGLNCDKIPEAVPQFDRAECEVVFKNENNAWIVLGRDRPYGKASGYGGLGGTQCGSIDLVVGRRPLDPEKITNPNFISDAARLYISQRTDIDKNMGLVAGGVGMSHSRSAIGMKADSVRIVARRGIKLVTGTDKKNSRDQRIRTELGIDLIAGNEASANMFSGRRARLQPLVLGGNTVDALGDIVDRVAELGSIVSWMLTHMASVNSALSAIPGIGSVAAFSVLSPGTPTPLIGGPPGIIALFASFQTFKSSCDAIKVNYLLEGPSKTYICSRHNRTN
jgi:hypothetical protein